MTRLRGELMELPGAAAPDAPTATRDMGSSMQALLRRGAGFWTVAYGSDSFQLKDTKGIGLLQRLLRHPG